MCMGGRSRAAAPLPVAPAPVEKLPEAAVMPAVSAAESAVKASSITRSESRRRKKRANNSGTILTSTAGILDDANTNRQTLLGAS